ncbi:hypothetical protein [Bacteroides gallinaceum]|uniref:hypothetical protein n=1 Tax=Bacteroides gallinaceum TaxID=1462571 RepID=UPI0025AB2876|nr:hypothetical protein [Bacteroides gallinaceum]MDN0067309.1 hypothetical protein [Bacteroides gallinaceum]
MKSVTNKELVSVILVNIGLLAAAVYMWLIYDRRQTIIKSEEPIQNYSVLEVNCRRRTSSSILIEFNGKQYYVAVARDKCIQFDPQKIKLFYDKERDKVYEECGAVVRHLGHYKIFCVNGNTGFRKESRIFYFIHLQNEEDYERKESSSA